MKGVLRIFQLPASGKGFDLMFRPLKDFHKAGYQQPPRELYEMVYECPLPSTNPEEIFSIFNLQLPVDYHARSLSVSDVIEMQFETHSDFYFCDSFGFARIQFEEAGDDA